jgi:hypothetical protein
MTILADSLWDIIYSLCRGVLIFGSVNTMLSLICNDHDSMMPRMVLIADVDASLKVMNGSDSQDVMHLCDH